MPKSLAIANWSPVQALIALNLSLVVLYLGLIAFAMSYAALQVEFADSIKTDEAAVGGLESSYLARVEQLTTTDYASLGYAKPALVVFVPSAPQTALNAR